MKILFFDDDNRRHKEFKRNSIGNIVSHATTPGEAISHLEKTDFDQIFLDYDMTDDLSEVMMDDYESGQVVADWIAEHADRFAETQIIIHSLSNSGSREMLGTLHSAGLNAVCVKWAWTVDPKDFKKRG